MNRHAPPLLPALALALAFAGGCGSGSRSSSGSSGSSGALATSAATPAQGGSTTATTTTTARTAPTAGLAPIEPPKYASPSRHARVLSGLVHVAYRNITIQPDTLRVRVGSTIRWTNFDPVAHNVTSTHGPEKLASGNLGPGATFSVRASRPGLLRYLCTIHPVSMNGTIEVVS
jgi:plastocyanin